VVFNYYLIPMLQSYALFYFKQRDFDIFFDV